MVATLPIASFKLQFDERRVRAVPATSPSGGPFAGPGVDLVLAEADAILALARPLLSWLEAREPVRVRSLSLDVGRRRLIVTVDPVGAVLPVAPRARPRVVKIDPGLDPGTHAAGEELVALAGPVLRRLGEIVPLKLAARGKH